MRVITKKLIEYIIEYIQNLKNELKAIRKEEKKPSLYKQD